MEKIKDYKHPESKQLFYGFRKAFIKNSHIPLEARFLIVLLFTYVGKNKKCWPSQGELAKRMDRNTDTVRKYLGVLEREGHLKIESQGIGRSLLYAPSYWKISAGKAANRDGEEKPTEIPRHELAEALGHRSINPGNKEREIDRNNEGIELLRKRVKELTGDLT